jgi:hypothetical protein
MVVYGDIAGSIHLMPIRTADFYIYEEHKHVIIEQLEQESSYHITPVTRNTSKGTNVTLGYNLEASIYVPHNAYNNNGLLQELTAMPENELVFLYLNVGYGNGYVSPPPKPINFTKGMTVFFYDIKPEIEIESVEYRPRLIIRIKTFSKNLGIFF